MNTKDRIHPVFLVGGSGTRLWPLSRLSKPKQFLSPLPTQEETLLERALKLVTGVPLFAQPMFIGHVDHQFFLEQQVGKILHEPSTFIFEPIACNTAASVALASLFFLEHSSSDALLFFLPADHFIEHVEVLHNMLPSAMARAQEGSIVVFGEVPSRADVSFGYIQKGSSLGGELYTVAHFKEKPPKDKAEQYVQSGHYVWNMGMFLAQASVFVAEMECFCPAILDCARMALRSRRTRLSGAHSAIYPSKPELEACLKIPLDCAVMEKTHRGVVAAVTGSGWCDIGNWSSLSQLAQKDTHGNTLVGDIVVQDVKESYIHSEAPLISAVGVENIVIVATRDAVLVSSKDYAPHIKNIFTEDFCQRSEFTESELGERPWGCYTNLFKGAGYKIKLLMVNPKAALSLQMHHHRSEHWVVLEGEGIMTRGEEKYRLTAGQSIDIPKETKHRIENASQEKTLVIAEVQLGSSLTEDDIFRFEDHYGRTVQAEEADKIPSP